MPINPSIASSIHWLFRLHITLLVIHSLRGRHTHTHTTHTHTHTHTHTGQKQLQETVPAGSRSQQLPGLKSHLQHET